MSILRDDDLAAKTPVMSLNLYVGISMCLRISVLSSRRPNLAEIDAFVAE